MPESVLPLPKKRSLLPARALRMLPDDRLAERVRRGDRAAFAMLYERYHQSLYRYSLTILRNPDDARDAHQTTMLNAFRALSERKQAAPVRPWLFRIAHNESVSILRRRKSHDELTDGVAHRPTALEEALARDRLATLLDDLTDLPERQRGALVMRELQGLSYEEIAVALETTAAAAKQTVFEARTSLYEAERGRDLHCEAVLGVISQQDGRALRGRAVRAHLRQCRRCSGFRASIPSRASQLAALPLLDPETASAVLKGILAVGGTGAAPGALIAAGAVKTAGVSIGVKSVAAGLVASAGISAGALTVAPDSIRNLPRSAETVTAPRTIASPAAAPDAAAQNERLVWLSAQRRHEAAREQRRAAGIAERSRARAGGRQEASRREPPRTPIAERDPRQDPVAGSASTRASTGREAPPARAAASPLPPSPPARPRARAPKPIPANPPPAPAAPTTSPRAQIPVEPDRQPKIPRTSD